MNNLDVPLNSISNIIPNKLGTDPANHGNVGDADLLALNMESVGAELVTVRSNCQHIKEVCGGYDGTTEELRFESNEVLPRQSGPGNDPQVWADQPTMNDSSVDINPSNFDKQGGPLFEGVGNSPLAQGQVSSAVGQSRIGVDYFGPINSNHAMSRPIISGAGRSSLADVGVQNQSGSCKGSRMHFDCVEINSGAMDNQVGPLLKVAGQNPIAIGHDTSAAGQSRSVVNCLGSFGGSDAMQDTCSASNNSCAMQDGSGVVLCYEEEQINGCADLRVDSPSGHLYEVPIMEVVDFDDAGVHVQNGGKVKRRRGRPRKKVPVKTQVSCTDLLLSHEILAIDQHPKLVGDKVWEIGRTLGVSCCDDEGVIINRLFELEQRDTFAIGREAD
ncbi:hypothetical protein SESBI_01938 [Sesbania bispinosa]|nr:hypothetical protein SESBI_01938 [Sesbania bispinosa]